MVTVFLVCALLASNIMLRLWWPRKTNGYNCLKECAYCFLCRSCIFTLLNDPFRKLSTVSVCMTPSTSIPSNVNEAHTKELTYYILNRKTSAQKMMLKRLPPTLPLCTLWANNLWLSFFQNNRRTHTVSRRDSGDCVCASDFLKKKNQSQVVRPRCAVHTSSPVP